MNIASKFQEGQSSNIRGVLLLLIAVLIFSIADVIIKTMSSNYAALQIVFIRSVFALPIVFIILYKRGRFSDLKSGNYTLQVLRGLMMFAAYIFFFLAIAALPYSLTLGIFFSGPLFITALSVPILGETVGWRRWLAVLVGFVGVIIVINPAGSEFDPATILALAAAFTYAVSIILTRKLQDTAISTAVYTTFVYLGAAAILAPIFSGWDSDSTHASMLFLVKAWTVPLPLDLLLIFFLALCWGIGMVLLSTAYRETDVAILAPFEYFSIFYGLVFGYIFWGEIPTSFMIIGVILIVCSGLFIIYRENRASI
ncbi:MAG: DMT family transporter [Anaerolineae bacterium]